MWKLNDKQYGYRFQEYETDCQGMMTREEGEAFSFWFGGFNREDE
jgi:hypothetical protein